MITWHYGVRPVTLNGYSISMSQDSDPVEFSVSYCPGTKKWTARLGRKTLRVGTLQQYLDECQDREESHAQ
jgi:hypothetical protein